MRPLLGIFLKVLSALVFTVMAAGIRKLSSVYPIGELIFFRSAFALVPLVIWLAFRSEFPSAIRTSNFLGHLKRSSFGCFGMFCGFLALSLLPLTEAVAIGYASPLFVVMLAAILLNETVRLYRWSAVIIGFGGVLIMLLPRMDFAGLAGGGAAMTGAIAALLGAVCTAGAVIQTRRLTDTEPTGAIVFYFSVLVALFGLMTGLLGWAIPRFLPVVDAGPAGPFGHVGWVAPRAEDLVLLIGIGTLGGIGQILMTQSFRYADASVIAPFEYTSMIWAVLLGWFVFGEWPTLMVGLGALIVTAAGIFVILREHWLGLERRKAAEVTPLRSA